MRIEIVKNIIPPSIESAMPVEKTSGDFGQMLTDALKEVNESQTHASDLQDAFLANRPGVEIQDVMIAMEKSSVAMQLTMQVRNKLLEAYQEISRMQI